MRTQTKYLETFVTAMEAGSFVRAAELLHVTPSTVSYQIRQLEEWLGASLFERTGRRVLPTALGDRLYAICGRLIDEMGTLRAAARGQAGGTREVLRIATGSSFGRYVLTPILSEPAFAQTVVHLRFGSDDDIFEAVAAGRADVGFAYTTTASNTLAFALAYRYPLVLVAPASSRGAVRRSRSAFADWLRNADFITYDDCETSFVRWFEMQLGSMPATMRTRGRCSEIEEAMALVAAGRGLSIVPRYMLGGEGRQGGSTARDDLRIVTPPVRTVPMDTVYHVLREGTLQDSAATALLAAVQAAQGPQPL